MAADLKKEDDLTIDLVKGGLGELSVRLDDRDIYKGNPLWYPTPASVIKKVRAAIFET